MLILKYVLEQKCKIFNEVLTNFVAVYNSSTKQKRLAEYENNNNY